MKYTITIKNITPNVEVGVYEKRGGVGVYELLTPIGEIPPNGEYTCECSTEVPIVIKPL